MGQKSIQVPQPQFSHWLIKRRRELNLTFDDLVERLNGLISKRTLNYLHDSRRDSFSEYTLQTLSNMLELNYSDFISTIEELRSQDKSEKFKKNKFDLSKGFISVAAVLTSIFFIILLANSKFNNSDSDFAEVMTHPGYQSIVIAFDANGNAVWQKNLRSRIQKVIYTDLNNDGKNEIIVGTNKIELGDACKYPGRLFIFDGKGKLLMEHNTWLPSIYSAEEPESNIGDIEIADIDNDGQMEIVTAIHGVQYHPSRLAVFQFDGKEIKEVKTYWNPGYVLSVDIEDVNNDGVQEIICIGLNNHFKNLDEYKLPDNVYSVFMLDGRSISGQAPPYFADMDKGSEIWYGYITPTAPHNCSRIMGITFAGDKQKEIRIKLADTCFFYLNYNGEVIGTYQGDHCEGETAFYLVEKNDVGRRFSLLQ